MKKKGEQADKSLPVPRASSGIPKKLILSTRQLFQMVRRRKAMIEAHLVLNGGLRATHLFTYLGNGVYLTEGIDGEEYETTAREFAKSHAWVGQGPVWHLDS